MVHTVVTILAARRGVHLARCHRFRAVELTAVLLQGAGAVINRCAAGVVAVDCCGDLPKARGRGVRGVGASGAARVNGRACEEINSDKGADPKQCQELLPPKVNKTTGCATRRSSDGRKGANRRVARFPAAGSKIHA